jgi:hypothetical protein
VQASENSQTGPFNIWVQSEGEPVGCQSITFGLTVIAGSPPDLASGDCYLLQVPPGGDWAQFSMTPTSGDLSPIIQLAGPAGGSRGTCGGFGAGFRLSQPGTWFALIADCSGADAGVYTMEVTSIGFPSSGPPGEQVRTIADGFNPGERVVFKYQTGSDTDPVIGIFAPRTRAVLDRRDVWATFRTRNLRDARGSTRSPRSVEYRVTLPSGRSI